MDVDSLSERDFTGHVLETTIHVCRHVVPEMIPQMSDEDLAEYVKMTRQIVERVEMIDDKTRKAAVGTLVEAMHDPNASWEVRVDAAKELLQRAFGQAPAFQDIESRGSNQSD